ncbi:Stp1/IreP family PP2C-type Ser/Thr phosphatase [Eggerthellaceae bacterium zg-1084]|uniref:Stp1/IreP family PP2C-type Ser/Thr phosphatase n=1 Tax=Berryella wangjianweii TaxID=2734634 RepID=A0A6M8J6K7_9ACTN|nr:Stp1/IreP family PP2C-type Ser/Thr phosphatase [Berryella wangjianweii]NPD30973.1 Stp1/IreP family PP2C-type Ser/Thr phosphatase [Berryella wangjianweii]NPD31838.1 Stp1/IreP family PP2C-type Ser/Thr phosphatase [Eggerthellaceae bacterium zg-997]QKF07566.1 Stp1/IreP family PP2C-type Ser/Thr phosphatase [Berryella wangjianweii]
MASRRSYRSTARTRTGAVTPFGSRTDVGCVREHNEDSLIVAPPLYVVADGMGGHAAGEVASEIAVSTVARHAPERADAQELGRAVQAANEAIIHAAAEGRGREGMGTTCTAAMIDEDRLVIAHVGDSRAYLYDGSRLHQLTRDHSLMANMIEAGQLTAEEARVHPNRSWITRALGNDPDTEPDLYEITVKAGDRLLLCSDGLTTMLRDAQIESTLSQVKDPQRCAAQLVNEAIAAGGVDNVTVVVVDIAGQRERQVRRVALRTKLTMAFVVLLVAAVLGVGGYGSWWYLSHSAYLADEDGYVAVYQGVPGEVLGLGYSRLVEVSDVPVADLPAGSAERIQGTLRVSSLNEAYALVSQYREEAQARRKGRS